MGQRGFDGKFDIDLKDGAIAEEKLLSVLGKCKIEVKNDFFIDKTGNIAIEFESYGKPSGISITEADWYAIFLANSNSDIALFIKTDSLKSLTKTFYEKRGYKNGGDDNASKFVLIPWDEVIKLNNYGKK